MSKIKKLITVVVFLITCSTTAQAITSSTAIGPKLGTQGIGVELRAPLAEHFFGRISGNYLKIKQEYGDSDLKLNGEITLLSVSRGLTLLRVICSIIVNVLSTSSAGSNTGVVSDKKVL